MTMGFNLEKDEKDSKSGLQERTDPVHLVPSLELSGVNTYLSEQGQPDYEHIEVVRVTEEEKQSQIQRTQQLITRAGPKNQEALESLRKVALTGGNVFQELMKTVKYASLGQITHLLYQCGSEYRRSM